MESKQQRPKPLCTLSDHSARQHLPSLPTGAGSSGLGFSAVSNRLAVPWCLGDTAHTEVAGGQWSGTMHRALRVILEPPEDTRAQVHISPGVIHFTWMGCPLVDTTWTIYNPHFKAKATEAWSASEMAQRQPARESSWHLRPRPLKPQAGARRTASPLRGGDPVGLALTCATLVSPSLPYN